MDEKWMIILALVTETSVNLVSLMSKVSYTTTIVVGLVGPKKTLNMRNFDGQSG